MYVCNLCGGFQYQQHYIEVTSVLWLYPFLWMFWFSLETLCMHDFIKILSIFWQYLCIFVWVCKLIGRNSYASTRTHSTLICFNFMFQSHFLKISTNFLTFIFLYYFNICFAFAMMIFQSCTIFFYKFHSFARFSRIIIWSLTLKVSEWIFVFCSFHLFLYSFLFGVRCWILWFDVNNSCSSKL